MTLTTEQVDYLKERVKIFNDVDNLHRDSKEIDHYFYWMHDQELVVQGYHVVKDEFVENYKNDEWYKTLSQNKIIQCLTCILRGEKFNDGLIFQMIKNGTFEKLVGQLSKL